MCSLNPKKGGVRGFIWGAKRGTSIGLIKWDTRSLDFGLHGVENEMETTIQDVELRVRGNYPNTNNGEFDGEENAT